MAREISNHAILKRRGLQMWMQVRALGKTISLQESFNNDGERIKQIKTVH